MAGGRISAMRASLGASPQGWGGEEVRLRGMDYERMVKDLVEGFGEWFAAEKALAGARMTRELYPYQKLFSPIQVNGVKLKNRLVMGPMGNISMADEMGRPGEKMIAYFVERARGGVGLITTGLVPVSHYIDPAVTEAGDRSYFPRIDRSRTVFAGWRDLAEGVHAYGARLFIQLTAGVGRVGSPECLLKKKRFPVSASWNPNFYVPLVPCRPLTDRECRKIIRAAGQAAGDARAMLLDGVYLHGHEGYLLEQMANRAFNRRRWGAFADWRAFGLEMVREIRRSCPDQYPIMYRIDLSLALGATYGERMEKVRLLRRFRRERTVEMTLEYMRQLVRAGVDMFDVDLGGYENWWLPHPPAPMPPGCHLAAAKIVKDYFARNDVRSNAGLAVPVVAVGKLGYPDLAEMALREGICDMVMLARPLLADPHWPNKAYAGRVEEIRPCIGDQEGCINEFINGGHPQCAVNPRAGFEEMFRDDLAPARRPKRIAVVGAGPAGVTCACAAAVRGQKVTLFERGKEAGGMLLAGSVPRIKFDLANYVAYLRHQLAAHARDYRLGVELGTEVTAEMVKAGGFDVAVTATGAVPCRPPVDGIDLPHVVQAVDLLRNPAAADGARAVVVVGGGCVGCETAYFLAAEKGKKVVVIEMLPYFLRGVCTANRGYLIHYLEKKGVELWNCTRLKSVEEEAVTVVRNVSGTVPDPYVTWSPLLPENIKVPFTRPVRTEEREFTVEADMVVLAAGTRPDDRLYEACVREMAAPEVYNIGDSFACGRVFEAVKAGYLVGRAI